MCCVTRHPKCDLPTTRRLFAACIYSIELEQAMSASAEHTTIQSHPQPTGKGAIASFFDTLIGTIMLVLLAAGLITITLTWRASDVEFLGGGQLRVTQSTWWGLQKTVTRLESSMQDGWVIVQEDDTRLPLRNRAMRLQN